MLNGNPRMSLDVTHLKIKSAKLTLEPSKCSLITHHIEFLGFVVESGQIRPGIERIRAIMEYPMLGDANVERRFLVLTGFLRRFVKHYAVITYC